MADCKKCIHYDICIFTEKDADCQQFRDADNFVELPSIRYSKRFDAWVLYYMERDCLQTCIMTKEQAEQKLKELKDER